MLFGNTATNCTLSSGEPYIHLNDHTQLHTILFVLGLLGAGLVAAGVSGELWEESQIAKLETCIRKGDDALFLLLSKEAGDAQKSAHGAAADASTAKEDARISGIAADKAQQKADAVAKQADDLLNKYVEAAANLEKEKVKRLELAASLLPRRFWDQSGAIGKLREFPPVSLIFEFPDEEETKSTAEQINFVASNLHWQTCRRRGYTMPLREGIEILPARFRMANPTDRNAWEAWGRWDSTATALCGALEKALQGSGIDAECEIGTHQLPPNTVLVRVGPKTNHVLEEAIKELARPSTPTEIQQGNIRERLGGNRMPIPEAEPSKIPQSTTCPIQ